MRKQDKTKYDPYERRTILEDWMLIESVYGIQIDKRKADLVRRVALVKEIGSEIAHRYGLTVHEDVLRDKLRMLDGVALDYGALNINGYVYTTYRIHPDHSPYNAVYTPTERAVLKKAHAENERRRTEAKESARLRDLERKRARYELRNHRDARNLRRISALRNVYKGNKEKITEPYQEINRRWHNGEYLGTAIRTETVDIGDVMDILDSHPDRVLFMDIGGYEVYSGSDILEIVMINGNGDRVYSSRFGTFDDGITVTWRADPDLGNIPYGEISHLKPLLESPRERKRIKDILDTADVVVGYSVAHDLDWLTGNGVDMRESMLRVCDMMPIYAEIVGEWNDYYGGWSYQRLSHAIRRYGTPSETGTPLERTTRTFPDLLQSMYRSPNRHRRIPV